MAHIYEKVVALITEEPSKRSDWEINLLLPWFQSMSSLFKAQKAEVVKDILRNCEFRSFPEDVAIITQGARGDSFYIILGGAVSIYINQTLEEQGNVTHHKVPKVSKKLARLDLNGNEIPEDGNCQDTKSDNNLQPEKSPCHLDRSLYGVHIRELGPGKSFGELALVQTNSIRNASVITEKPTDLIVIDRELYNRSLKAAQKQEVQMKLDFVNANPLFSNWTKRQRSVLTMSLMRYQYQYGNTIIRQGSPAHSLIFITKGQAKVTLDPIQLMQQYPLMCSNEDVNNSKHFLSERIHQCRHRRRRLVSGCRRRTNDRLAYRRIVDVCQVGPPDHVGDFEVLLRLPTYVQTVTCTETVDTFELDLTSFTRLIAKKNQATYDYLHHVAEMKLISRVGRFRREKVHNPVLEHLLQRFSEINEPYHHKYRLEKSSGPRWYQYREKQRLFLQQRQRQKETEKKHQLNLMRTQRVLFDRELSNMTLGWQSELDLTSKPNEDNGEILPVISPDSRININPASGLVRLPRRMYSLDETSTRSVPFNDLRTWQRPRSQSIALPPGTPLLPMKRNLSFDAEISETIHEDTEIDEDAKETAPLACNINEKGPISVGLSLDLRKEGKWRARKMSMPTGELESYIRPESRKLKSLSGRILRPVSGRMEATKGATL